MQVQLRHDDSTIHVELEKLPPKIREMIGPSTQIVLQETNPRVMEVRKGSSYLHSLRTLNASLVATWLDNEHDLYMMIFK
jgi:mRNA-degrading endonuclease RelE of RelBE toxin-antitoxin system